MDCHKQYGSCRNRNKKTTSPLECTFERKNLGQVKSEGSENSRRDVSPEYLTLTERKQQSNPNGGVL